MAPRLLIAEDSPTQRETLRTHLATAGYGVDTAVDGQDALDKVTLTPYDLLISDVVMPNMDGYELCRSAKQRRPRLPVILLTSMTDPLEVVRGLQAGADNFLRKPYDEALLLTRIRMMLHNAQLRDSGQTQMGLELFFLNQRFMITAERQQILDLLVSTFEDLVAANEQLRGQEASLATARDRLAEELAASQEQRRRLHAVLAAIPEAMVVVDAEGVITAASTALAQMRGGDVATDLIGRPFREALRLFRHTGEELLAEERPLYRALTERVFVRAGGAFDLLAARGDGTRVPVVAHAAPIVDGDGRTAGAIGIMTELQSLSLYDPLTHLPRHSAFALLVDEAVKVSRETGQFTAVVVLSVDRVADLRDSLDKQDADRLVVSLAGRLKAALDAASLRAGGREPAAAYLGDWEFAVVLPCLDDEAEGLSQADAVRREVAGLHRVGDLEVVLTVSAGFSVAAGSDVAAETLVPAAAAAAHLGVRHGGDRLEAADPEASRRGADRLRHEADLRRGIDHGELVVHYQPIVALDGGVVGAEALVRWLPAGGELVFPDAFIPMAERSGLVVPLGWEVLTLACRQMRTWRDQLPGAEDLVVNVNLSPQQLMQGDLAKRVEAALADSGLPPEGLSLEITESGVVEDPRAAVDQLTRLRQLGIGVAIDDFGTGFSSLLQLRTLPVDALKIDREFVNGLMTNTEDAALVAASISLAIALRLSVVAEGVEHPEQAEELRRLGCDSAQGYLWSRPLPAPAFQQWWASAPTNDRVHR